MDFTSNPRSVLHALQPFGCGTPEIESLLSYFCRLALSHSTSTIALSTAIAKKIGATQPPNARWHELRLCGLGDSALAWSTAISILTSMPHLHELTFQPWRAVIGKNGLPINLKGKFCAACFEEDLESGRTPYFRLAWEAADVRVCHRHYTALRQHCWHCKQANVRHKSAFVAPGWCTRCGGFLGESALSDESIDLQAVWSAKQVADLPVDVKVVAANYSMLKRPIQPAGSAPSWFAG